MLHQHQLMAMNTLTVTTRTTEVMTTTGTMTMNTIVTMTIIMHLVSEDSIELTDVGLITSTLFMGIMSMVLLLDIMRHLMIHMVTITILIDLIEGLEYLLVVDG